MKGRRIAGVFFLAGALVLSLVAFPGAGLAQTSGSVKWNGWAFSYEVSGEFDGLSLKGVQFQGLPIIFKLSFPVMRVFYQNNSCGPYTDRLGGTLSPIPWAGNALIAKREFTLNGRQWYEIGIRDQIGNYDIYQVYYLSTDGLLDAHVYSKGLQCVEDHVHYPNWRIDFDIETFANDWIQLDTGAGYATKPTEFNANATEALNHGWRVGDSTSGKFVDVLPGFTDFTIPDANTQPVTGFANHTVFGRRYQSSEDTGWTYGPNTQVPHNNGESINAQDIVLWYEAYLPHLAAEGSELWHSTGLRLAVNGGTPPPPPPPPGGGTQTFSNTASILIPDGSASPYPSTITVAGMSGLITKVVVKLTGLNHTYPDDIDLLLVGPGGQKVLLMSDVGGGFDVGNVNLTFDSAASTSLPNSTQILSGTYLPTNIGTTDSFGASAPSGPYSTSLDVLNGATPNGSWQLFLMDDEGLDTGSVASGWELTITTN
jgi:subtilisin-like proprotein convertase family protein